MILVFVAFWSLFLGGLFAKEARERLRDKSRTEWLLDLIGLLSQGALVPLLEIVVVMRLWGLAFPGARGSIHLGPVLAFVANVVAVDYLYYWNHRLLHRRALWRIHAVHHSITTMDVLGTARNVVWGPALIVYVYVNGTLLFLLDGASAPAFALGAAVTAALDLWRHSRIAPRFGSLAHRALAILIVTPHEHARHHARDDHHGNYGANLSLWDRIHRTFLESDAPPSSLGVALEGSLGQVLFLPPERSR